MARLKDNIVRRQARKRQPLPSQEIRFPRPKPVQPFQDTFSMASFMPMLMMGMVSGGIAYIAGGRIYSMIPMLMMPLLNIGFQWYGNRQKKMVYEQNMAQQEQTYRRKLSSLKAELEKITELQQKIMGQENPPVQGLEGRVKNRHSSLWERQPDDNDFLALRLGIGELPLCVKLTIPEYDDEDEQGQKAVKMFNEYRTVETLPIVANLKTLGSVGIRGQKSQESLQLIYAMLLNLAVHHSPDEVHLYVISQRVGGAERWEWARWLPHANMLHSEIGTPGRLSFYMEETSVSQTEEEVLLGLSKELRKRQELTQSNNRGDEENLPYLVVVCDQIRPELFIHFVIRKLLSHTPHTENNVLRVCGIFIDNIPARVNALIELKDRDLPKDSNLEYHETWSSGSNSIIYTGKRDVLTLNQIKELARILAPFQTVDNFNVAGGVLPSSVRLVELLGSSLVDKVPLERFYNQPYNPKQVMSFPIGLNVDAKPHFVSLREKGKKGHGQHAILAGGTGGGKSITLQTIVLSLAATHSPRYLNFVLADFKAGASELSKLKSLPHVVGFVTDLKPAYVRRFRLALEGEIERRKKIFEATPETIGQQITNIYDYNEKSPYNPLPHLVIVIDEFHKARQMDDLFQVTMDNGIAAQGRALGMHLILSTQKAKDFGSVLPNIEVRMSLRMNSAEDSKEIFKRDDAFTKLKRPGQAFLQAVADGLEQFEMFQSARADVEYIPEGEVALEVHDKFEIYKVGLEGKREKIYQSHPDQESQLKLEEKPVNRFSEGEKLVELINTYCRQENYPLARPICLDPLPEAENLPLTGLLKEHHNFTLWQAESGWTSIKNEEKRLVVPIGRVDLPSQQRQEDFILDLNQKDGNFWVVGPPGSGKNLFLKTAIMGLTLTHSPDDFHFYMIIQGQEFSFLEGLPHCGTIIHSTEEEQITRLFIFLEQTMAKRRKLMSKAKVGDMATLRHQQLDTPFPAIILVIENFVIFKQEYEDKLNSLINLAANSKQADIHLIVTSTSPADIPAKLRANLQQILGLGLKRGDYRDLFNTGVVELEEIPGRGYVAQFDDILECQIAHFYEELEIEQAKGKNKAKEAGPQKVKQQIIDLGENWAGDQAKPIIALTKHLDLFTLWGKLPLTKQSLSYQTAVLGLDYEHLAPVSLDVSKMEPAMFVVGPSGSGKTEFLTTLCLSITKQLTPERVKIYIVVFEADHPLQQLEALPHVELINKRNKCVGLLTNLAADLANQWERYTQQQDKEESSVSLHFELPQHTLIVVDDIAEIARLEPKIYTALEECYKKGGLLSHIWIADTATILAQLRTSSTPFIQAALKMGIGAGAGVTLSVDNVDLGILTNNRIKQTQIKYYESHIGQGRGFLTQFGKDVLVQFGTVGTGDKEQYPQQVKNAVQQLKSNLDDKTQIMVQEVGE